MILSYLKIALRNLARNSRRSAVTATITAISIAAMMAAGAINNGIERQMVFSVTGTVTGDIVIEPANGPAGEALDLSAIPAGLAELPGVAYTAPRVISTGILSCGDAGATVNFTGITGAAERRLVENLVPVSGLPLTGLTRGGVAVSSALADRLGLASGERVIAAVAGGDSTTYSRTMTVQTVFSPRSSPGWIEDTVYMNFDDGAALAGLQPGQASVQLLFLEDPTRLEATAAAARERLADAPSLRATTWKEGPYRVVLLSTGTVSALSAGMEAILMLMIAAVIITTVLMATLERSREMGIYAALGFKRKNLLALLFLETAMLQAMAIAAGAVIAWAACSWLAATGIPATSEQLVRMFAGHHLYPNFRISDLIRPAAALYLVALGGTLAGAWRGTGREPVILLGRL